LWPARHRAGSKSNRGGKEEHKKKKRSQKSQKAFEKKKIKLRNKPSVGSLRSVQRTKPKRNKSPNQLLKKQASSRRSAAESGDEMEPGPTATSKEGKKLFPLSPKVKRKKNARRPPLQHPTRNEKNSLTALQRKKHDYLYFPNEPGRESPNRRKVQPELEPESGARVVTSYCRNPWPIFRPKRKKNRTTVEIESRAAHWNARAGVEKREMERKGQGSPAAPELLRVPRKNCRGTHWGGAPTPEIVCLRRGLQEKKNQAGREVFAKNPEFPNDW